MGRSSREWHAGALEFAEAVYLQAALTIHNASECETPSMGSETSGFACETRSSLPLTSKLHLCHNYNSYTRRVLSHSCFQTHSLPKTGM